MGQIRDGFVRFELALTDRDFERLTNATEEINREQAWTIREPKINVKFDVAGKGKAVRISTVAAAGVSLFLDELEKELARRKGRR